MLQVDIILWDVEPDSRLWTAAAFLWIIGTGRDVMGRIVNNGETERKFLIVYTVLALAFLAAGVSASMTYPMFLGTVPEIIFCWGIYSFQAGDRTSRAVILTVSSLVTMAFFGVMVTSMDILVPLFAVLLVLIGMFNSSLLLGLWAADAALMFLYHLLVRKSYALDSWDGYLRIFYQLFCLAVMLYLEKVMIRKNNERKKQMSERIEFLQESERSKDEFMSGVCRRLKSPLNAVCGRSELILAGDVPDEVRKAAEYILASGRNMQEFVREVLDYVEIESGRQALKEEAYSIALLIKDILDMADRQNSDKKLEIAAGCDEDVPCVMLGDSEKIRSVVMCLMNNAIKYTNRGSVTLNVSAQKESFGVNLCISVRDTGVGMTRETAEGIFNGFGRGHAEPDGCFRGMDLGLALTKRYVEMMKGSIRVTSEPGTGSEFCVVIPQRVNGGRPMGEASKGAE